MSNPTTGDISPEHTARAMNNDLHPEVGAAYAYVDRVLHTADPIAQRQGVPAFQTEPVAPTVIGPEWQPCVKLPVPVYVREQRPSETHSNTRNGSTPLLPDDLIMRGVQGEEYPIGRELFNQTYRMGAALAQPEPVGPEPGYEKGYAQEHLARLMRDAIGTETNHNAYILAAGKILDRPEFAHVARWGAPAIQPVSESEPLPGPEDWDVWGRCWMFDPCGDGWWAYRSALPSDDELGRPPWTHWLPHWALPIPC